MKHYNMMKNIPVLLLVVMFTTGCMKSEQAVDYNDFFVKSIDTAMVLLLNTEDAIQKKEYKEATEKYKKLQRVVDEKLKSTKDRPVFNDEVELQKAAVEWLQYYKQVCEVEYRQIFEIVNTDSLTENDIAKIDELIFSSYSKEEEMHNQFIQVQKEFAEKYNFELKRGEFFYYDDE